MSTWVATAYGALDLRDWEDNHSGIEVMILPCIPSEPIGLAGENAALWRLLVDGPVDDDDLDEAQRDLVREYAEAGIASADSGHAARIRELSPPWLVSPLHELVYALVASLARDERIGVVFIKGPVLHQQGLRDREHSGDVDVWVDPSDVERLVDSLRMWGWRIFLDIWHGTDVHHSVTLKPDEWGCELDLHRSFPGLTETGSSVFGTLKSGATTLVAAGVPISVPNRTDNAVIHAVHTARPTLGVDDEKSRFDQVEEILTLGGPDVVAAAGRLGATSVLRTPLLRAYPSAVLGDETALPANWNWRLQPTRLGGYLMLLRGASWRDRFILGRRLLWPPRESLIEYEAGVDSESEHLVLVRLRRLRRLVMGLVRNRRK